jgi:hypothetical protein
MPDNRHEMMRGQWKHSSARLDLPIPFSMCFCVPVMTKTNSVTLSPQANYTD